MAEIYNPCILIADENIRIDDTARIDSFCKIEGGQGVDIGARVHIASFAHVNTGGGRVIIKEGASVASHAVIVGGGSTEAGASMSAVDPTTVVDRSKTTTIGCNACVLVSAVVLSGVTLGEGAILMAGGVASRDIPDHEVWGGVPARFIRMRRYA